MLRLSQLFLAVGSALVFWHWVDLEHLSQVFQTLTSAVSILLAAVFVRLNRGLPTLDWKVVSPTDRTAITSRLVQISLDYVGVLIVGMLVLAAIIVLGAADPEWIACLPVRWQSAISAGTGILLSIFLFRMGYVVWLDLDIIQLQKAVIDRIEEKERADKANEEKDVRAREKAADKIEAIKQASLKTDRTPVTKL